MCKRFLKKLVRLFGAKGVGFLILLEKQVLTTYKFLLNHDEKSHYSIYLVMCKFVFFWLTRENSNE